MIVCVLLVSNCQGCCLAPRRDNTRGSLTPRSPSDRPPARQHPREFHTNNTQTIMFDPDYNMMPPFFSTATNILLIKAIQNLNREQPQSPLPCHHVILVASITVAFFAGDWACEIELRQTDVICVPWRQQGWSCGVFKSCPFQWKWQVLHNYDISVLQQVGMFFDGIACLTRFGLCSSGSSLVSRWRDVSLVLGRRCQKIDPHWLQGRQMRFWRILSTISWK